MNDVGEFLDEFKEEFVDRVSTLVENQDDDNKIRYDILMILVENLLLKYQIKSESNSKGLIKKILGFSDNEDQKQKLMELDHKIDQIINSNGKIPLIKQAREVKDNPDFTGFFKHQTQATKYLLPSSVEDDETNMDQPSLYENKSQQTKKDHEHQYSKTHIPKDVDIGLIIDPLDGKDQDHSDYFILPNGSVGIVICDGVSGDGKLSAELAERVPKKIHEYMKNHNFELNSKLENWENLITESIDYAIQDYDFDGGASTLIVGFLPATRDKLYLSWLGDGNAIYFNPRLTSYSKLLAPHRNSSGDLTASVTHDGIFGSISSQIIRANGGLLILSSDGYNLTNRRILRHLYMNVLKCSNLHQSLDRWNQQLCCSPESNNEKYHPNQTDDRSMIMVRWGIKEQIST